MAISAKFGGTVISVILPPPGFDDPGSVDVSVLCCISSPGIFVCGLLDGWRFLTETNEEIWVVIPEDVACSFLKINMSWDNGTGTTFVKLPLVNAEEDPTFGVVQ